MMTNSCMMVTTLAMIATVCMLSIEGTQTKGEQLSTCKKRQSEDQVKEHAGQA